ncbi:MAG: hypothetical protein ACYDA2_08445 [Acidimicrobiales bacterium]
MANKGNRGKIREEALRRQAAKRAAAREEQLEAARARRKGKLAADDVPTTRRASFFRRIMRLGPMRRFYARRMLKFLDKSEKKGRTVPPELAQLEQYLKQLPANQRRAVLEAGLSGELESQLGRAARRAAQRQERRSGQGKGARPGMLPVQGPRPKVR